MIPGLVVTDIGNAGADRYGIHHLLESVDSSCDGMIKIIGETSREKHSGKPVRTDGTVLVW
jgi:norsolorinic acid ketoreductase